MYGRAALLNSRQQHQQQLQPPPPGQQQVRPYEDVFNANNRPPLEIPIGADNLSEQQHRHFQQQQQFKQQQQQQQKQFVLQQGYPPHIHAQQEQNRFYDPNLSQQMPNNINNNSRQFQQFQVQQQQQQQQQQLQQQHQQQMHPDQMRQARPASTVERVPRPHSADFLEYERQFGPQQEAGPGSVGVPHRGQSSHHRLPNRPQPPRPKSSIEQRIPAELRRQMIEQQNVEEGLVRLSTTTPTPRLNNNLNNNNNNSSSNNNNFAYAQQIQNLHLENSSNRIVNNVNNINNSNNGNVQNVVRAPTTPRQPETSTPNYRDRPQKMNYNVSDDNFLIVKLQSKLAGS